MSPRRPVWLMILGTHHSDISLRKSLDLASQMIATLWDGFEGNAQSFRIVTKLALRSPDIPGLNLTRATLNALLKYPWTRQSDGHEKEKYGISGERRAS